MRTRGGGGQKIQKFCGRHIWMAPYRASRLLWQWYSDKKCEKKWFNTISEHISVLLDKTATKCDSSQYRTTEFLGQILLNHPETIKYNVYNVITATKSAICYNNWLSYKVNFRVKSLFNHFETTKCSECQSVIPAAPASPSPRPGRPQASSQAPPTCPAPPNPSGCPTLPSPCVDNVCKAINRVDRKSQVRQCLGFCAADIWSLLAYESAEQKPKHFLTWDLLSALAIKYNWIRYVIYSHALSCPIKHCKSYLITDKSLFTLYGHVRALKYWLN